MESSTPDTSEEEINDFLLRSVYTREYLSDAQAAEFKRIETSILEARRAGEQLSDTI